MTQALQVSGKVGDAIYVIGGASYDEFAANLAAATDSETAEQILGNFSKALLGNHVQAGVNAAVAGLGATPVDQPAQQQAPQQSGGPRVVNGKYGDTITYDAEGAPNCKHKAMVHRNWKTQQGAWKKAWLCPNDKKVGGAGADVCDIEWDNSK